MNGRYVSVDDTNLWVESYGDGPDLLWLGGGASTTDSVRPILDALAQRMTVHALDARAHGRSGAGRGHATYARMAADAAQLIAALGFDTLPVMGHSDGGCVAMHLLFDHEHVVSAAVISGAPYDRTGYSPAATTMTRELPAQLACGTNDSLGIRQALLSSGLPDETLRATGRALLRAWSSTPNFTLDMLRMIERPVLVIEAGADPLVSPEHMKRLAAAIPDARTLSMPTMTHDPGPHIAEISDAVAAFLSGLH